MIGRKLKRLIRTRCLIKRNVVGERNVVGKDYSFHLNLFSLYLNDFNVVSIPKVLIVVEKKFKLATCQVGGNEAKYDSTCDSEYKRYPEGRKLGPALICAR